MGYRNRDSSSDSLSVLVLRGVFTKLARLGVSGIGACEYGSNCNSSSAAH